MIKHIDLIDLRRAQANDIGSLARARHQLSLLECGKRVPNLTMAGALANVSALTECIENRAKLIESRKAVR